MSTCLCTVHQSCRTTTCVVLDMTKNMTLLSACVRTENNETKYNTTTPTDCVVKHEGCPISSVESTAGTVVAQIGYT